MSLWNLLQNKNDDLDLIHDPAISHMYNVLAFLSFKL